MFETTLLSSLHRVYPDVMPSWNGTPHGFRNEPISFQLAYRSDDSKFRDIYITLESELPVSLYSVIYQPFLHMREGKDTCGGSTSRLCPDMLVPLDTKPETYKAENPWNHYTFCKGKNSPLFACGDCNNSVWITVNENGDLLSAGEYDVKVSFFACLDNKKLCERNVKIRVDDGVLPKQSLIYTNWFHCDCLADFYREEPFSERFFEIVGNYARSAATHGMNMILLPAFTPPLDTPIGKERMRVQLVRITKCNGYYDFDFSLMKRFIEVCLASGIEYFEHNHLFTQWGATSAPAIYGEENGEEKLIFGWDTDASGKEYGEFIREYLTAVKKFFAEEKLSDKVLFHISDEPSERMEVSYRKAVAQIGDLLDGYMVGDALSSYSYYEDGTVKLPIVATHKADDFAGRCPNFWLYNTGAESGNGMSNRNFGTASEANRSMGVQLYHYGAKGFLQWGFNYWYSMLSNGFFDPRFCQMGYDEIAGTSYCVYPSPDGKAYPSIRQKVFYEGICDYRALELLEQKSGKTACEKIIEKHFGKLNTYVSAKSPEAMLAFRDEITKKILE